jgi:prepilin-type N-terminal cleavage/methylation domain-containing protein
MSRIVARVRRERRGMTLIEIMISLVLIGIIGGVVMRVVMRQQRFYQGVNQIMTQRSQLRQATSVVPMDLRSVSSVGGDIVAASDGSIEFDVNIGTGVVCAVLPGGTKVVLPPVKLSSGTVLTTFYGYGDTGPDPAAITRGVSVYIYNDSSVAGNADDKWKKFDLVAMGGDPSPCLTTFAPTVSVADAGQPRPILQLSDPEGFTDPVTLGPVSQYINPGAPVRLVKRVRYKLYKESDNKWYLGFSEYNKSIGNYDTPMPVSGPYDAYSSTAGIGSGLGFRYYDVNDIEIASGAGPTDRARIARIDLVARARTSAVVRTAGIQNGVSQQYKDSLAVSVMLRNRQ